MDRRATVGEDCRSIADVFGRDLSRPIVRLSIYGVTKTRVRVEVVRNTGKVQGDEWETETTDLAAEVSREWCGWSILNDRPIVLDTYDGCWYGARPLMLSRLNDLTAALAPLKFTKEPPCSSESP